MVLLTPSQLATLIDMLSFCRPHGTSGDRAFRALYLLNLPGADVDPFDNIHVRIGDSAIVWSAHTDTVHRLPGRQDVANRNGILRLARRRDRRSIGTCLGADDGAGCFILREMILRGIPGHYVFHYGEESGGIGSGRLARHAPELLAGAKYAIALDRRGTSDVITSQFGGRCASDVFAWSLAAQLPGRYAPCRGLYTDTAEYTDLIPECTNLSVGYSREHSGSESLDTAHVARLLDALYRLQESDLVVVRDPEDDRIPASVYRDWESADLVDDYPVASRYFTRKQIESMGLLDVAEDYVDAFGGSVDRMTADDLKFLRHIAGL